LETIGSYFFGGKQMALLTIDGTPIPTPIRGLTEEVSTNVNSGRNANGELVGEKVGRDIYKLNNMEWRWLTKDQWAQICSLVGDGGNFKFQATFPDMVNGGFCTHLCYCGNRTAEPYYINNNGDFTRYKSCKMNIIDCGLVNENN
jgi:hypothetical protein